MAERPNFIDLRANSYDSRLTSNLPSPRAGEVPPALSPLDALVAQNQKLAQQFEQSKKNGRRISRLPPNTVESELRSRPGFFRSISAQDPLDASDPNEQDSITALPVREQAPESRHKSFYPVIHSEDPPPPPRGSFRNELSPVGEAASPAPSTHDPDYFGIPRAHSPDGIEPNNVNEARDITPNQRDQSYSSQGKPRTLTVSSGASVSSGGRHSPSPHLLPLPQPSPGYARSSARASPSIRSVPNDLNEDFDGLSLGGSYDSLPSRQFSSGSNFSNRAQSPYSPLIGQMPQIPRSPSISSEYSVGGTRLARPSFNFSRSLSQRPSFDTRVQPENPLRQTFEQRNDSRTSLDVPVRQDSGDSSLNAYPLQDVHTPVSMTSEDYQFGREEDPNAPPQSYIYSKYELPRGRNMNRESIGPAEFMNRVWDNPSNRNSVLRPRPLSPPSPPRTGVSLPDSNNNLAPGRTQETCGASFDEQILSRPSFLTASDSPSLASSNSTIRPTTSNTQPTRSATTKTMSNMSAEEHLTKGIECHQSGSLQKSTYHLRLAARGGLPTGMLLYALACRHGWGMRPNQAEGVKWLKQAVDLAQSEVVEDENSTKQGKKLDLVQRKEHKAQFALGIYELAQSYMNGWGVAQDKKMALRCYEIAGNWGDADALTEAGYCYTEAIGCKKDLKKAAHFYRMAADKGVSMVGNNWIYKDKYMDKDNDDDRRSRSTAKETLQKKPRDKSRTRSIFGRKKSVIGSANDPPMPS